MCLNCGTTKADKEGSHANSGTKCKPNKERCSTSFHPSCDETEPTEPTFRLQALLQPLFSDNPPLALVPHPHEQGLLGGYSEASVERRRPACRDRTSWDWAARPGVQAGQRVEGGMTRAEGESAGQLLNLNQRNNMVNIE